LVLAGFPIELFPITRLERLLQKAIATPLEDGRRVGFCRKVWLPCGIRLQPLIGARPAIGGG
jgi:hypothetical protein